MSRLILVCLLAMATPSLAERIVVAPLSAGEGASEKAASKFSALVEEELKKDSSVEVVTRPRGAKAAAPSAASASKGPSAEAVSALAEGKKAYDDLRFEDAVPLLRKGIDGTLADAGSANFEAIFDSYVKLAAAAFRMGEEKEAKRALFELARLNPSFSMPGGFPPVFLKEFEKAHKRVEKQPKGQVSIEGPSGATAYLDGRDLGMVPVVEENVPAGTHYAKVEAGKGQVFGQSFEVKGSTAKVKLGAAPAAVASSGGVVEPKVESGLDESVATRAAAYAKAAGAELALVGVVYRVGETQLTAATALYSVKHKGFTVLGKVTFDTDVLTANTEAFKLAEEVAKKAGSFGAIVPLPIAMAGKGVAGPLVSRTDSKAASGDADISGPKRRPVLTPGKTTSTLTFTDDQLVKTTPPATEASKGKVSGWVWVAIVGVALAGAGVGSYFGIREATKPVTGTVSATW